MEEVIEMTGISRKLKESLNDRKDPTTRPEVVKDKESKPSDTPPRKTPVPECYNCGEKGHKRPECTNPRKKINNVEAKMEEEEETDSDEDTGSQFDIVTYEPYEAGIRVIQADIGDKLSINTIQGDSNLP